MAEICVDSFSCVLFSMISALFPRNINRRKLNQGMIQSNNKHADTCVVSNDDSVSTCKAMAFFMDRYTSITYVLVVEMYRLLLFDLGRNIEIEDHQCMTPLFMIEGPSVVCSCLCSTYRGRKYF